MSNRTGNKNKSRKNDFCKNGKRRKFILDTASYKRVVLKLSGESLAGSQGFGIDLPTVDAIAAEVRKVREHGIDVAIIVGGGNI